MPRQRPCLRRFVSLVDIINPMMISRANRSPFTAKDLKILIFAIFTPDSCQTKMQITTVYEFEYWCYDVPAPKARTKYILAVKVLFQYLKFFLTHL